MTLEGGEEVCLAGLLAPLPRAGAAAAEPFFEEARNGLGELTRGRRVRLFTLPGRPERDRWGRIVARAFLPDLDGVSVGREMIARGLARVRPEDEIDGEARALLGVEATARTAGEGLWSSPYFAVRPAEAVGPGARGSFQLVEGVVVDAAAVNGWLYLNFGPDYRSDFTAGAPPEHSHAFDEAAMLALPAARVRVRGEIESFNGPFIRLVAPAQVERLDA
jgi:hypothetical protein